MNFDTSNKVENTEVNDPTACGRWGWVLNVASLDLDCTCPNKDKYNNNNNDDFVTNVCKTACC